MTINKLLLLDPSQKNGPKLVFGFNPFSYSILSVCPLDIRDSHESGVQVVTSLVSWRGVLKVWWPCRPDPLSHVPMGALCYRLLAVSCGLS